jgi:16S rRNA (uracil1498-N3)-methyltransferase
MPISRIFQPISLSENTQVKLDEQASHHLARVLRASLHEEIILFNGAGGEYQAVITNIEKKTVTAEIKKYLEKNTESPIDLYLAQGISRGEKMDYTIQKAVELGVKKIIPLLTERCNVKLDAERRQKRIQHWQSIIISACEQSGRVIVPELVAPLTLQQWLPTVAADLCFTLAPKAQKKLQEYAVKPASKIVLLIGPEGGLSETEIQLSEQKGFLPLNLGPRILRTETAAVAALTALQCFFGDLGR